MSQRKDAVDKLEQLIDDLVRDVMSTTDEEIQAESEGEPGGFDATATHIVGVIDAAIAASGAQRLEAAKQSVAAGFGSASNVVKMMPFAEKRRLFERFVANDGPLKAKLTMAARNGEAMTEEELDGILDDLGSLGVHLDQDGKP